MTGVTKRTKTTRLRTGLRDSGRVKISIYIESTAANFDPKNENYDEIRAAAHVLACFGSPYACPSDFLDKLQPTIRKVVWILENMIDPPDEAWDFLEIWENSPEIIAEVERQIAELKAYLG